MKKAILILTALASLTIATVQAGELATPPLYQSLSKLETRVMNDLFYLSDYDFNRLFVDHIITVEDTRRIMYTDETHKHRFYIHPSEIGKKEHDFTPFAYEWMKRYPGLNDEIFTRCYATEKARRNKLHNVE